MFYVSLDDRKGICKKIKVFTQEMRVISLLNPVGDRQADIVAYLMIGRFDAKAQGPKSRDKKDKPF